MSTTPSGWRTVSDSAEQTEQLAEKIGQALRGGEVIELVSDLGGGKTTFVRGLVRGMGSADKVASPTFTVSKVYQAGKLEVHHFDFYRLRDAGVVANELAEVAGDPDTVVVVEWADIVQHVLPNDRLTIVITQQPDGTRDLRFTYAPSVGYLMEAIR